MLKIRVNFLNKFFYYRSYRKIFYLKKVLKYPRINKKAKNRKNNEKIETLLKIALFAKSPAYNPPSCITPPKWPIIFL